jgi:hypothetical protein
MRRNDAGKVTAFRRGSDFDAKGQSLLKEEESLVNVGRVTKGVMARG